MKSVDSGTIIRHTYLMRTKTAKKGTLMTKTLASKIVAGDQIELITIAATHPNALDRILRQQQYKQGPKAPVEFVHVVKVEAKRSRRTFFFVGGSTMTVSANSKVTTS